MYPTKIPLSKVTNRMLYSPTSKKMFFRNRGKQDPSWYTGGIYFCTHYLNNGRIAAKIEEECERRNIPFKPILAKERALVDGVVSEDHGRPHPYDARKVFIPQSPEVTELKMIELADWVLTTINTEKNRWYTKSVWIQRSCDVDVKEVDDKTGIELHWVKFLCD